VAHPENLAVSVAQEIHHLADVPRSSSDEGVARTRPRVDETEAHLHRRLIRPRHVAADVARAARLAPPCFDQAVATIR
jgi:hypothetical protein